MVICNASVFFSDHPPVGLMLVALLVFLLYSCLKCIGMDSLGRSSHGFLLIFLSLVACVSVDNVPLVCRFTSLKLIAYSLVLYPFFYFRHDMNRMHLLSLKLLSSYLLHPWQFANVNHAILQVINHSIITHHLTPFNLLVGTTGHIWFLLTSFFVPNTAPSYYRFHFDSRLEVYEACAEMDSQFFVNLLAMRKRNLCQFS